jgi:hypothetical protein
MFWGAGGAGLSAGLGAGAGFAVGVDFATGFGAGTGFEADVFVVVETFFAAGGFLVVETFFADVDFAAGFAEVFFAAGFFVAEAFFAGVDLAAGLAAGFLTAVFFTAGLDAFLAGTGFVFFTGFEEDLLFFAAAGFLDGLIVLFVVFFFDVSFFTINTSFENLIRKYIN